MKHSFAIIVLTALTSFANAQSQKTQEQSYVYFFRGGQFGAALANFTFYIDGHKTCKLSNDKYFKFPISPGTHEIDARLSGAFVYKKETSIIITTEAGKSNYVSCDVKRSLIRARIEMIEVVENAGKKAIATMKEDNCQEDIPGGSN
jgi:uncharacterized protein DUF2846